MTGCWFLDKDLFLKITLKIGIFFLPLDGNPPILRDSGQINLLYRGCVASGLVLTSKRAAMQQGMRRTSQNAEKNAGLSFP